MFFFAFIRIFEAAYNKKPMEKIKIKKLKYFIIKKLKIKNNLL